MTRIPAATATDTTATGDDEGRKLYNELKQLYQQNYSMSNINVNRVHHEVPKWHNRVHWWYWGGAKHRIFLLNYGNRAYTQLDEKSAKGSFGNGKSE